jgi:tetratricopeptide (TPR) repeat protein
MTTAAISDLPKICLNMIVKNESRVIMRLLESVSKYIDYYCICDTGSTDDTITIIREFFESRGIPGAIYEEPFRDFGYNRSFALEKCHTDAITSAADYILLLDADMKLNIKVSPDDFRSHLAKTRSGSYCIFQGSATFFYKNVRILANRPGYSYWGVTHEYISEPEGSVQTTIPMEIAFINDIGDGGSKQNKYERDIQLLLKGLEELPNNDRYTFYLANSYRGAGQHESAIEYYKKRIALGGWREEVWNSYLAAGHSYKDMGQIEKAVVTWLEGYDYWDGRVENLYEIIHYYRIAGKQRLACKLYEIAEKIVAKKTSWDNLFLHKDVYDYLLDYEMTILGYYHNDANYDLRQMSLRVISHPGCPTHISTNVMSNYKFYSEAVSKWQKFENTNLGADGVFAGIGRQFRLESRGFVSSTPSITLYDNTLIVNVRYVNYSIDEGGNYINGDHITTVNVIAVFDIAAPKWVKQDEFILGYDETSDGRYVGLEDVRLTCMKRMKLGPGGVSDDSDYVVLYNANRGVGNIMAIEHGIVDLQTKRVNGGLVKIPNQGNLEKNWVILPKTGLDGQLLMVYGWHPLKIGGLREDGILDITYHLDTPKFFQNVRGSTNGVIIGDEIWLICHYVSYEDRRYYYHLMVVLDANTYKLKCYTRLFTMEGEKVEYTTGFVYLKNLKQFLIGYSIMDKTTKWVCLDKSLFDSYMITCS